MIKGIDVSDYQGIIDWDKVKKDEISFAILRCGIGDDIVSQDDALFERNYKECKKVNMPIGVYLYSYAESTEQAKSEAEHVIRLIKNKTIEYPIFYDLEDENTTGKCSNKAIAEIAKTFFDLVKKENYEVGTYANKDWFETKLTEKIFNEYPKWVASYGENNGKIPDDKYEYNKKYMIWQYTSMGKVNGIKGNVDENIKTEDEENTKPEDKKVDVIYQTYTNGRWQPNVKNTEDYAGVFGMTATGVYANLSKGDIIYKVHLKGGKWLPEVKNRSDYAGILGKPIDGLMMKSSNGKVKYRVHLLKEKWLPWVTGYSEKDSNNGYAGILGKEIDAIQIKIE